MANIGTRLLELRRLYGWTQRDLAERLEVDAMTVSRWERGVTSPRRRIVRQLDRLFAAASVTATRRQRSTKTSAVTPPPGAPSRFEGVDELVRVVGLDRALAALRELALIGRPPTPVQLAVDPNVRLREVETALREQVDLIARARIGRR